MASNTFEAIPADKRERILNAALGEFASKGYTRASTNAIVAQAGIAKGLLFHYFKSKKQLYLALYAYCIQVSLVELYSQLDLQQVDVIARLRQLQSVKLAMLEKHPDLFHFIQSAYLEQDVAVHAEIAALGKSLLVENLDRIYSNLDFSVLREGVDPSRALKIILWSMDGFVDELLSRSKLSGSDNINYDEAFQEMDAYLVTLQRCLYR